MARKQSAKNAKLIVDQAAAIAEYSVNAFVAAVQVRIKSKLVEGLSLQGLDRETLTTLPALPAMVRKKLASPDESFTVAEIVTILRVVSRAIIGAGQNQRVDLLQAAKKLMECLQKNIVLPDESVKGKKPKAADLLYQFKITLKESKPPIWRRILVKDCTLDKLHEHIQTAMGWTNSHLNHFKVGEQLFGDPMLMQGTFEEFGYEDSTTTKLSDMIPPNAKKFKFIYECDFGDSWYHEIVFEGCPKEEPGKKYPLCVDGKRACPPEDCGGIWGYPEFLEAIENPDQQRHDELLEWIGGSFDPEAFEPAAATKAMKKGLPDWRREAR